MSRSASLKSRRRSHSGPEAARLALTLVELLIVITIIAILVGLLLPAILATRQVAHRAACENNIRQITLGFHYYMDVTRGHFPVPPVPERPSGWAITVLPYIEEESLYRSFDYTKPLTAPENLAVARKYNPQVFLCPVTPETPSTMDGVEVTNYVVVIDNENRARASRSRPWEVKDAPEGSRFPWCTSPEILHEDARYPPPHPGAYSIFGGK